MSDTPKGKAPLETRSPVSIRRICSRRASTWAGLMDMAIQVAFFRYVPLLFLRGNESMGEAKFPEGSASELRGFLWGWPLRKIFARPVEATNAKSRYRFAEALVREVGWGFAQTWTPRSRGFQKREVGVTQRGGAEMSSVPTPESSDRTQIPVKLKCPKCSHVGSALWEENSGISPRGPMASLEGLSDGFYHRIKNAKTHLPEVVCGRCGTVLPD